LTPDLIDDLREASQASWSRGYMAAFDELWLMPERRDLMQEFMDGLVPAELFTERFREWFWRPWNPIRSLVDDKMASVADAFARVRPAIAEIPSTLHLEEIDSTRLNEMAGIFKTLDDRAGVGATIASHLLAPLRPALFPTWDDFIANEYGFALDAAGYQKFLAITQGIAKKAREFWRDRSESSLPLEGYLLAKDRQWSAPLAKVIGEWNWLRITHNTPRFGEPQRRKCRPGMEPVKEQLRQLIQYIDAGRVHIRKVSNGTSVSVSFVTDNGWKLSVFNDAGHWDFLEWAEDPKGNALDYDDIYADPAIDNPQGAESWGILCHWDIDPEFPGASEEIESDGS
jgi:hypothetical protein